MDLAALTGVLSGAAGIVVSVGTLYGTNRASRKQAREAGEVSWQSLNKALADERDKLAVELTTIDDNYRRKIADMRADYDRQLAEAHARITQLEGEVEGLFRRLYQSNRLPPP